MNFLRIMFDLISPEEEVKGSNTGLIIGIVLACVVLAFIIIKVIKKKKNG